MKKQRQAKESVFVPPAQSEPTYVIAYYDQNEDAIPLTMHNLKTLELIAQVQPTHPVITEMDVPGSAALQEGDDGDSCMRAVLPNGKAVQRMLLKFKNRKTPPDTVYIDKPVYLETPWKILMKLHELYKTVYVFEMADADENEKIRKKNMEDVEEVAEEEEEAPPPSSPPPPQSEEAGKQARELWAWFREVDMQEATHVGDAVATKCWAELKATTFEEFKSNPDKLNMLAALHCQYESFTGPPERHGGGGGGCRT